MRRRRAKPYGKRRRLTGEKNEHEKAQIKNNKKHNKKNNKKHCPERGRFCSGQCFYSRGQTAARTKYPAVLLRDI